MTVPPTTTTTAPVTRQRDDEPNHAHQRTHHHPTTVLHHAVLPRHGHRRPAVTEFEVWGLNGSSPPNTPRTRPRPRRLWHWITPSTPRAIVSEESEITRLNTVPGPRPCERDLCARLDAAQSSPRSPRGSATRPCPTLLPAATTAILRPVDANLTVRSPRRHRSEVLIRPREHRSPRDRCRSISERAPKALAQTWSPTSRTWRCLVEIGGDVALHGHGPTGPGSMGIATSPPLRVTNRGSASRAAVSRPPRRPAYLGGGEQLSTTDRPAYRVFARAPTPPRQSARRAASSPTPLPPRPCSGAKTRVSISHRLAGRPVSCDVTERRLRGRMAREKLSAMIEH